MFKKILITALEIALIALVIWAVITITNSVSFSEELYEAWVICQPGDYVNVRMNPSKRSQVVGFVDGGDRIMLDGTSRNGFLRCYGIGELGVGWIHKGFVVYDEPVRTQSVAYSVSKARVACRRWVNGKIRKWLKNLDEVTVYWISDEWCVTNKGFVKTEYLEMEGT